MVLPQGYDERVYAGVLGKIIGVYLGRPFEGWTYEAISERLGEIRHYVHDRLGVPLVVTDDDLSGTFTFVRALQDHGCRRDLTSQEIGQTWLNGIVEGLTTLWWGGMGNSTEHTAYLRLRSGVPAPASGSRRLNGTVVSEQIGAQIFIDGWGMVAPGDLELAAELAGRAARVSHDGEAVFAAQVIAAMEAGAFLERDVDRLLDGALGLIPADSLLRRMIDDVRTWHAADGDWRRTRERIQERYGYDRYGGNCHVIPNHALVQMALLYGRDDFDRALTIVNTSGWDTDCNSGNVGCLMGLRLGLEGLGQGADWRGPVRDRLFVVSADGGRAITDAVREAEELAASGRALAGVAPWHPKGGARFHFDMPGAVQGFAPDPETGSLEVRNVANHSRAGRRSLALGHHAMAGEGPSRVLTPTFIPPEALGMQGYPLVACPTLYAGQTVRAQVQADAANAASVACRLVLRCYGAEQRLEPLGGPVTLLEPGHRATLDWRVPETGGQPVASVGLELDADTDARVYLDWLTWDGSPEVVWDQPPGGGQMWLRAWVPAVDHWNRSWLPGMAFTLVHNRGTGLAIQGTRAWRDYGVEAEVRPHLVASGGLAARVQGLERYYALLLVPGSRVRLIKVRHGSAVLAEASLDWELDQTHRLALEVDGARLRGWVDGNLLLDVLDGDRPLESGAVALVVEEGRLDVGAVHVRPARAQDPAL